MSQIALAAYRKSGSSQSVRALAADGELYDLEDLRTAGIKLDDAWSRDINALLEYWTIHGRDLKKLGVEVSGLAESKKVAPVPKNAIAAPYRPERIYCAASNYIEHANEMGTVLAGKAESKPYMFIKLSNTIIGPNEDILMPAETCQLDWEIELAAIIGRPGRRISTERALDHLAGYSIVNDISARDLNVRGDYPFKFDWFQGKCHDTFAPFGPWIVPVASIADPQAVEMQLSVNGQIMQKDSTKNMIWTLREQIAYLSTIVTLQAGDVIATGTPTGVGMARGIYLKPGDVIVASIDGIGCLTNKVAAEER
jgi:2-keto-4-pentenoate hydratase/2-oxohepta-3-ene-1,7-dioic acid hydratase in catechol pathway